MSSRLNQEREKELAPKRYQYAKDELKSLGFDIVAYDGIRITFEFKGETVSFWPYSGWHSGKTISDGRGIENLLEQLKND